MSLVEAGVRGSNFLCASGSLEGHPLTAPWVSDELLPATFPPWLASGVPCRCIVGPAAHAAETEAVGDRERVLATQAGYEAPQRLLVQECRANISRSAGHERPGTMGGISQWVSLGSTSARADAFLSRTSAKAIEDTHPWNHCAEKDSDALETLRATEECAHA